MFHFLLPAPAPLQPVLLVTRILAPVIPRRITNHSLSYTDLAPVFLHLFVFPAPLQIIPSVTRFLAPVFLHLLAFPAHYNSFPQLHGSCAGPLHLFAFRGAITTHSLSYMDLGAALFISLNSASPLRLLKRFVGRHCAVQPNGRLCCGRRRAHSEQSNSNGNKSIIILKLPVFGDRQHQALSWASDAASPHAMLSPRRLHLHLLLLK